MRALAKYIDFKLERALVEKFLAEVKFPSAQAEEGPLLRDNKWLSASELQKAIRRGRPEIASRTVSELMLIDSLYVWRRLRIIALEDVGLANIELCASVLALAANASTRTLENAKLVAAALSRATKSRAACDLLVIGELGIGSAEERQDVVRAGPPEWLRCSSSNCQPTWRKSLSAMLLAGLSVRTRQGFRTLSRCEPDAFARMLEELGVSDLTKYVALRGHDTDCLNATVALADATLCNESRELRSHLQPNSERLIGGRMALAYCMYTQVGNRAFELMVRCDPAFARELRAAGATVPARALGYLVFHVEGGVLNRYIDSPMIEMNRILAEQASRSYVGLSPDSVGLYAALRERMDLLQKCRHDIIASQATQMRLI